MLHTFARKCDWPAFLWLQMEDGSPDDRKATFARNLGALNSQFAT
jgi:hypothetical protein